MKDDTVELLAALDPTPLGDAFATQRQWIETYGEQVATAADAPIRTTRALLLLLDVLVGITTGRLAHDQRWWHTQVTAGAEPAGRRRTLPTVPPTCGTYRCLAGWLVTLRWPTAKAVEYERLTTHNLTYTRYSGVMIDGEPRSYNEMGARALDVEPITVTDGVGCGDPECPTCRSGARLVSHAVDDLFSGCADLTDLWTSAHKFTGRVVTVPTDLVSLVDAARVVAW